jgi:hypothetical protein
MPNAMRSDKFSPGLAGRSRCACHTYFQIITFQTTMIEDSLLIIRYDSDIVDSTISQQICDTVRTSIIIEGVSIDVSLLVIISSLLAVAGILWIIKDILNNN